MTRINTRIPVIALDYINERHKAVEKELLVDYDNGNIYVVSKDDKSIIIDITGKIKEQLESMTGDKIEINIEGIGTVNLTEVIKKLQFDIQNSVQVVSTGEDIHYVGKENVLDEKSLEVVNKRIQLKGFSSAETHMIPRKGVNGELEWINMLLLPEDGSNNNGNTSSGDIIPPGNPDDAQSLLVTTLEPINDKIYLRASRRQKSVNISKNCIVIIPRVLDQFCEIEWYVVTNDFTPLFRFSNNILWADVADTQPKANSHHVYKFKSWDAGETWIGEIVHYNKVANESTNVVDINYLKENYLDKNQINKDYYNKTEIDDRLDDINTVDPSNYYDKQEMEEKYYDKDQVTIKLEELNVEINNELTSINQNISSEIQIVTDKIPDVSNKVEREELDNYYNKEQVDTKFNELVIPPNIEGVDLSNYYNKQEMEEKYYDKEQVEGRINEINALDPVNYYDKKEVDNKLEQEYYDKNYIDSEHYNRQEVDDLVSWKQGAVFQNKLSKYRK